MSRLCGPRPQRTHSNAVMHLLQVPRVYLGWDVDQSGGGDNERRPEIHLFNINKLCRQLGQRISTHRTKVPVLSRNVARGFQVDRRQLRKSVITSWFSPEIGIYYPPTAHTTSWKDLNATGVIAGGTPKYGYSFSKKPNL
jgi:hypothetical protein